MDITIPRSNPLGSLSGFMIGDTGSLNKGGLRGRDNRKQRQEAKGYPPRQDAEGEEKEKGNSGVMGVEIRVDEGEGP